MNDEQTSTGGSQERPVEEKMAFDKWIHFAVVEFDRRKSHIKIGPLSVWYAYWQQGYSPKSAVDEFLK